MSPVPGRCSRKGPFRASRQHFCRRGMAQSGLARLTGGQKVAGSNPVAPMKKPRKGLLPFRGFLLREARQSYHRQKPDFLFNIHFNDFFPIGKIAVKEILDRSFGYNYCCGMINPSSDQGCIFVKLITPLVPAFVINPNPTT